MSAPVSSAWSTSQLTELLQVIAGLPDEQSVTERAVEHVVEAFEAEVGAFLHGDDVVATIGFARGRVPVQALLAAADGPDHALDVPGVGSCSAVHVECEALPGTRLLLARSAGPLSSEQLGLLRAMARVLGLTLTSLRVLETERRLREHSDRQAQENCALLASLRERQALLERLSRITSSISSRKPLQEVLDTIVAGARELIGEDVVALRLLDPDDPAQLVIVSSIGVQDSLVAGTRRSPIGVGVGGLAVAEDRLVVQSGYGQSSAAIAGFVRDGIASVMAAPIRERGRAVGSLIVGSRRPDRVYSASEQDALTAFAEHAGLAFNDAQTVQALHREAERATHQSLHDSLTGLPNRALFLDRLARARERGLGHDREPLAVLFLDVDDFKVVNDSLGHLVGDRLLTEVATRIVVALRHVGTVARLGGDEFAVLLEGLAPEQAERAAERVLAALTAPFEVEGNVVHVGASIGLVTDAGSGARPEELLRDADVAMYRAKDGGKSRVVVFEAGMRHRLQARTELEAELRLAVARDEFVVHYQPIVDVVADRVVGVEALLRWQHARHGLVSPADFIPLAEDTGIIVPLGAMVVRTACREAAAWQRLSGEAVYVSVNLSPRQLFEPDLVDVVADALRCSGLPPELLVLEITERLLVPDLDEASSRLHGLKGLGVRLAVDDFGTGYSSLTYLSRLPVDVLKVDKAFVAGVAHGPAQTRLAGAVVALAQSLDLATVAEGVETLEQEQSLRELGARSMQGYLYSWPVPAAQVPGLLASRPSVLARPVRLPAARRPTGLPAAV